MKFKFNILTIVAAVGMLFVACDDNDDYKAGQPTDPESPGVGFSVDTPASYMLIAGSDESSVDLNVCRKVTDGALTVPVEVIYATEGLIIPESVTFADGESETVLTISGPDTPLQSYKYSFSLTFPSDMVDYYSSESSIAVVESYMTYVNPEVANCYFYDFYTITGGEFDQKMIRMGENEYLFPDFFKSGYDMTIVVDPSNDQISIKSPMAEYAPDYGDYVINTPMYPGDGSQTVYVTDLYIYDGTYSGYYSGPDGSGFYLSVYVYFDDGTSGYDYIYIEFPE